MKKSHACLLLVLSATLLLAACATPSPLHCAPSAVPAEIPPLPKSARQPTPSQAYSERVLRNIERWGRTLQTALPTAPSASAPMTP